MGLTVLVLTMSMYTFTLLSALCVFAAFQVPATSGWLFGDENQVKTSKKDIVSQHNSIRRNVQPTARNMLEMSWSNDAESNAKKWAKTCSMTHSRQDSRTISTSGCGENLYRSNTKETWRDVIKHWENEKEHFLFGEGSTSGETAEHYIQLVWATSNSIGCAAAYCPKAAYKYFYVCQYCRPGNGTINRPYKTGPSCSDCANSCEDNLCTNPCPYIDEVPNCDGLRREWGCQRDELKEVCRASCQCKDKIY